MAHGSSSNASVLHGSGSEIRLRLAIELPLKDPDLSGVSGSSPITRSSPSSKAHQKSGAFPPPELPGFFGTMSLSDSRRCRRPNGGVEAATLAAGGSPPLPGSPSRRAVPITPADRTGAGVDSSPSARPSPFRWRVGIHDFTFEACSGFTHVTARPVAQPPEAAFVTRLRPGQLPNQAARQLPDLSTAIWVDSSSTGHPCLCGAHSVIRGGRFNTSRC
jgi:hypothetical protein